MESCQLGTLTLCSYTILGMNQGLQVQTRGQRQDDFKGNSITDISKAWWLSLALSSDAKFWAILELSLKSLILGTNAQNSAWDGFSNLSSSRFELEFVLQSKGRIFFWLRVNGMGSSYMYAKPGLPNLSLGYFTHNSIV